MLHCSPFWRARAGAFATALALLASPMLRADEPVEPPGLRSLGDLRAVNVEEELTGLRDSNQSLVGSATRQPATFASAVTKARTLARDAVPAASLQAALRALPDNEPTTLRLFAFGQLATGRPTVSFALLVAALDRAPDSADLLSDIAGMLAGFGHPNEALAILDELAARGIQPTPPMGLGGQDITDYIRGYALARLGDKTAATRLLQTVAQRQPLLAEASLMLAILSDDPAEQRKTFLQGVWRHRSPQMVCAGVDLDQPDPDPASSGEQVAVDARALLDPAKAKRGRQPLLRYAQTVLRANDIEARMPALKQAAAERRSAIVQGRGDFPQRYIHTDTSIDDTWGHQIYNLVSSLDYRDAKLRELDRKRRQFWREREDARRRIQNDRSERADVAVKAYMEECLARKYNPTTEQIGEKMRPFFEAALAEMAPYINREELVEREWFAEWHYLATGLAAQVGDEAWHRFIQASIDAERWQSYSRLLHLVDMHASVGELPYVTREAGEVGTEPEDDPAGKCDSNKSVSFGTSTLPGGKALPFEVGVEMTCEGMSLEASVDTRIPGISISAEIGGDNSGAFTAFVGPKAEVAVGDKAIAAFTGSAKAGAYVTGNKNGVTDAGVKYEVKTGGKIGAFSGAQKVAEGSVSFIPAPVSGGGPGSFAPPRG